MTPAQRKALSFLAGRQYGTPAEIGYAITEGTERLVPLRAQGAGRLGGTMATRLVKLGWAAFASRLNGGYSAYAITAAGRIALREIEGVER